MTSDDIGERGEAIFRLKILQVCGRTRPFFRPHFLGEKFTTLDFLVELLDPKKGAPYFFAQVKATTRGWFLNSKGQPHLKTGVSREDVQRMIVYPAPTYAVGIDEMAEQGYIISVNEPRSRGFGSISMRHPLTCDNLQTLWDEVHAFWDSSKMGPLNSKFAG